jgi:hypothetical protein
MSKAKTASKNNPNSRESAKEFFYQGKKIKPVKVVTAKSCFFAAEYDGTGDIVMGADGHPIPWQKARYLG